MSNIIPKKPDDVENDGSWLSQHTRFLCQTKAREPDVVLIGDSIIKFMQYSTPYKKFLEPLHCLNFGICGDKTENILWRINNGEMDGISPKVIIVHAGTDCVGQTAEDIVDGIATIASCIQNKQPKSTVILLGMLPCGREANPRRIKHSNINKLLTDIFSDCKVNQLVLLLPDWESLLQAPDAIISHRDLYDYVHPTDQGYGRLIECQLLDELQISLPSAFHIRAGLYPSSDAASLGGAASGESS